MQVLTDEGIKIDILPDCARCNVTGLNPEYMGECPMRYFDFLGLVCRPNSCDEYEEDW